MKQLLNDMIVSESHFSDANEGRADATTTYMANRFIAFTAFV